jgi:hypothetical protein
LNVGVSTIEPADASAMLVIDALSIMFATPVVDALAKIIYVYVPAATERVCAVPLAVAELDD